jgi:drug/metabolite transporter (DMT)-like permease
LTEVSASAGTLERRGVAIGATSFAVVLWSVGSTLAKSVDLPGQVLSLHRVAWAALLYVAIVGARGSCPTWQKLRLAAPVGVCYALTNVLFFIGVKSTTVANATIIQCLQPIPIMLVANRLFGEPVRRREVALSVVALGGVGLVVFGSATTVHWSPRGDLLSAGSLVAWVGYFVFNKQVRAKLSALELQATMLPIAAVVLLGVAVAMGGSLSPGTPSTWAGIVAIIATAGTGHLLMSAAAPHLPITEASLLTLGQPVVAVTLAAAFLNEGVVAAQVVGMVVVLAAMAGVVTARS